MAPIKVIIFFIFLSCNIVFSQTIELGVPYCQNITPNEIGYGGAMYSIAQDNQGTMLFGNFNGIISYNGSIWKNISCKGKPILFQDGNNQIYVGGYNFISKFELDEYYRYVLIPLTKGNNNFGQIEKIQNYNNQIYFIANKTLYYISNGIPKKLISDNSYMNLFVDRNRLFISTSIGLYEFVNDKLQESFISKFFKGTTIIEMFRFSNALMVRTPSSFFKILTNNTIEEFKTQIDNELQWFEYSCSQKLSNNTLCVATKKNGLYFINENGKLVNYLNSENGLNDNNIYDLFIDRANNLWAGFSNGICRIEIPSAFTYYTKNQGLYGKVNSITRYKNYMYVATETGVYKIIKGESNANFKKIFQSNIQSTVLFTDNTVLYAGTNHGLYNISNDNPTLVIPGDIVSIALHSPTNQLWVATKTHVNILQIKGNTASIIQTIGPFSSEINTIAIANDSTTWIGTYYEGVYRISKQNQKYTITKFLNGKGLPKKSEWIEVYKTTNDILFSTNAGLYRFDSRISVFYKDNRIDIPIEYIHERVTPIVEDKDKNIWLSFKNQGVYENQIGVAWNTHNLERFTLILNQFNKLNRFICSTIYPDNNSIIWFGGFDGLVRMDFKQLYTKKNNEPSRIHSIYIGDDSLFIYNHNTEKSKHSFDYSFNSIRFEFNTPIFENSEKILHTYILEGYMNEWSKPKHISGIEFLNLKSGKYTFKVKSIDIYGNVSPESTFEFTIKPHPLIRWWAFLLYAIIIGAVITIFTRWRSYNFLQEKTKLSNIIRQRTEELLIEKEKTENILRNILPEQTAKELKEKGKATSMRFEMATILFSDIQGFTKIAEEMAPDILIDELDKYFLELDKIVERHSIEKIKTIGDAYMCAGGIPEKNRTNPIEVVVAALEMQYQIRRMQETFNEYQKYWGLRIGIHTGPVIAGVVGSKKYSYDIWGDSVNIASRMESSGEVGKVNISETTFILIQEFFDCEYRGKMPVKYKGEIDMYFVKGFKVSFSEDPLKIIPNTLFEEKLALLKFDDLHEAMLERYEKELPKDLYYHNLKHTIDVIVQIEIIGQDEGVSDQEMLLLKTAALFHDSGFLVGYKDHEELGIQLTSMILPKYKYSENQIKIICELIAATKLPHSPKNILEEIICDADLDYLGRNDYMAVSRDLYKELLEHNMIKKSEHEWNLMQIKFLQHHKFFTNSSKNRRNANKNKQIQHLQEQTKSFKI